MATCLKQTLLSKLRFFNISFVDELLFLMTSLTGVVDSGKSLPRHKVDKLGRTCRKRLETANLVGSLGITKNEKHVKYLSHEMGPSTHCWKGGFRSRI
jgi:hypothetical protein